MILRHDCAVPLRRQPSPCGPASCRPQPPPRPTPCPPTCGTACQPPCPQPCGTPCPPPCPQPCGTACPPPCGTSCPPCPPTCGAPCPPAQPPCPPPKPDCGCAQAPTCPALPPCPPPRPFPRPPKPTCPPCDCAADSCAGTSRPQGGYLLPQIVAWGREWKRRWHVCLTVEGIPDCARPPFTLLSVSASQDSCTWEVIPQPVCSRMLLRVTLPLVCQVRDCTGCVYQGSARVETEVCLQLSARGQESWRTSMMVLPCVRLVSLPCASNDLCFDAQLELLVEAYLTRWEPCMPCGQRPVCPPDLPLYPHLRCDC